MGQHRCGRHKHTSYLGDELRALRRFQREQEPKSPFVFTSERGAPFTTAGFARMVERAGSEAKLGFKARPHMLQHACGYAVPTATCGPESILPRPRLSGSSTRLPSETATATGTRPCGLQAWPTVFRTWLTFAGSRLTSERPPCTSAGSRRALPARIRSGERGLLFLDTSTKTIEFIQRGRIARIQSVPR
jgi:hypothetical protein